MRVGIRDRDALLAVSPAALSAYAQSAGWRRDEPYRRHSDTYVGEDLPEIVVPRTERLGDYASVVAGLIELFAGVARQDELAVYRALMTADRDVVHVRAGQSRESANGVVTIGDAVDLIAGARDLLLAAACSLEEPRAVYRAGARRRAGELLKRVRLGQMDQGGFAVTLLTAAVPPRMPALSPDHGAEGAPIERRLTRRLMEATGAARRAADLAAAGDASAFEEAVPNGASANLCEALARAIGSFATLEVAVSWARTRPVTARQRSVRFCLADAPRLRAAASALRERGRRADQ